MNLKVNNGVFSKSLLLIVGVIYFLNYIYSGVLPQILSLVPAKVVHELSLWRLITFPFVPPDIESVVFFAVVFYYLASRIERYIAGVRLAIWLSLITILQGSVLTLLFMGNDITFAGMDGAAFYVLVFYSLISSKDRIEFLNFPSLPVQAFSMLLVFLWFGLKLVNFSTSGNSMDFLSATSSALFGITAGLIHYLQLRFYNNLMRKREEAIISSYPIPKPEELSMAHSNMRTMRKMYERQNQSDREIMDEDILSDDMSENEDKLNEILDKIGNTGKESLTDFERKFLDAYSRRI
ncbi:hypothetical protein MASR1M45_29770 [Candidatus Kapaibacterium sp.]